MRLAWAGEGSPAAPLDAIAEERLVVRLPGRDVATRAGLPDDLLIVGAGATILALPLPLRVRSICLDVAEAADRALLLAEGVGDCLVPGSTADELLLRGRRLLSHLDRRLLRHGSVSCDIERRRAWRGGRDLALHPREFALLCHLIRCAPVPQDRAALLRALWQMDFDTGTNRVAVLVHRLRAKLDHGEDHALLVTGPGGYRLAMPPHATLPAAAPLMAMAGTAHLDGHVILGDNESVDASAMRAAMDVQRQERLA